MKKADFEIRTAEKNDWQNIIEIYNESIQEGGKTADTELQSVDSKREWLAEHLEEKFPIILGLVNGQVIGWCSLSPFRPGRKALSEVLEISYYIMRKFRGQGYGSMLINESIKYASKNGFKNLIAILLDINSESIRLLNKFGFEKWGHLPNIADLGNTRCGQFIYGKKIESS